MIDCGEGGGEEGSRVRCRRVGGDLRTCCTGMIAAGTAEMKDFNACLPSWFDLLGSDLV
jgi:hypothetical protein